MWSCLGTHFRVTADQPLQTFIGSNRIPCFGQQWASRQLPLDQHLFRVEIMITQTQFGLGGMEASDTCERLESE
jgi:hypothetical protein